MEINIGDLRHRVVIQSLTNVADGQGGATTTWTTLDTVWAKIEPIKSYERLFADRVEYQRTHFSVIRYRSDVTTDMRFSFDSRLFQIKGIRKLDEKKFFLLIDLEENKGT